VQRDKQARGRGATPRPREKEEASLDRSLAFYIEKIVESMGYPAAAAKVYAYLVLREGAATISDIAAGTGLGKSTVAMNLKLLEHDGLVYSVKQGKQKLFYARSALPMVIMYPMKVLKEYGEPLLHALEKAKDRSEHLARLYREVTVFLHAYEKAMKVFEDEIKSHIGQEFLAAGHLSETIMPAPRRKGESRSSI